MSRIFSLVLSIATILFSGNTSQADSSTDSTGSVTIRVPIGGNSWVDNGKHEQIKNAGLIQWTDPKAIIKSYLRLGKSGKIKLQLKGSATTGKSKIKITIGSKSKEIEISGAEKEYNLGEWIISQPGYLKITAQGISRSGKEFGRLSEWILTGEAVTKTAAFVKDSADNFFYWGRRGPSVHLNYPLPAEDDIEWFYNEVTVPEKQDVIGSYFMANGFGEGYFGMQVNSDKERRILFSVWSPFQTDDPGSIPKDKQISMLRKGTKVYTGEFGNEGSGGQSYLKYNWKAGNTYKFLLHGKPSADSSTTYTAYFFAPETAQWQIIASFKRPKTHTYLKKFHSFLENFLPETGDQSRLVYFGNQWIRNTSGEWKEINQARFTADATARKRYRLDYAGGEKSGKFFLKNCGFFDKTTDINESFTRAGSGKEPFIDFSILP